MKRMMMVAAALAASVSPALAQDATGDNAKSGFRAEIRSSYETPTVSSIDDTNNVYKLGSALSFGGEIGFDAAVGDAVVVGPFVTYEKSSIEGSDSGFTLSGEDYLLAGLHVGYKLGEKGQLYGKVGYAQFRERLEGTGQILLPDSTIQTVAVNETDTGKGVGFALGYEHSFGENFYGRLEGGYADVGSVFGTKTQRRHVGIGLGVRF